MKIRAKVLIVSPWGSAAPNHKRLPDVIDIKDDAVAESLIKQGKAEAVAEEAPKEAKKAK